MAAGSTRMTTAFDAGVFDYGGGVIQRNQRIGLRVVGRGVADRSRIGTTRKSLARRSSAPVGVGPLGDQVDALAVGQAQRLDVGGIDERPRDGRP